MDISNFCEILENKYNYSNELMNCLKKIIPALITYYGEDKKNIIFESLLDCEIHIQKENEDYNEYLKLYFETDKDWDLTFLGGAFYEYNFNIENNKIKRKDIIYICSGKWIYTPFNFDDVDNLAMVVHEICHLIKSYGYTKVDEKHLILSSGLNKDFIEYDERYKQFKIVKSINYGLEEALNINDEEKIVSIILGKEYKYNNGYGDLISIGRTLMECKCLSDLIRFSQFLHDDSWMNYFGQEDSMYFSKLLDEWIKNLIEGPLAVSETWDRIRQLKSEAFNFLNLHLKNDDFFSNSNSLK